MKKIKSLIIYLILIALSVICIFPLLYAVETSLVSAADIGKLVPPTHITLENYIVIFTKYNVWTWIKNSIFMTACVMAGNAVIGLFTGYAISHFRFPGRKLVYAMVLVSMMVPFQLLITPIYIQVVNFGWTNTMKSIIIPFLAQSIYIFLTKQYFDSFPFELEEAAKIDGITRFGFFARIAVPIAAPLYTTIIILSFTGNWNSFFVPSTLLNDQKLFPLAVGLNTVKSRYFTQPNLTLAGTVLLTLPVLIVYFIFQKWFIQGVATSGIKQ